MLPKMEPVERSRTKNARATKLFEIVRVGILRLFFSHFELIAFQVDGESLIVCEPLRPISVGTGGHVAGNRLQLQPDKSKWLDKDAFEKKWHEASKSVLR